MEGDHNIHTDRARWYTTKLAAGGSGYAIVCLRYRTEEFDGAVYTEYQGQDRMLRRPLSMQKSRLQQEACMELAQVVLAISGHGGRQDAVHIISG